MNDTNTDSVFQEWIREERRRGRVPFGTAYELFAKRAWDASRNVTVSSCDPYTSRYPGGPTYGQLKIRLEQAMETLEAQRLLLLSNHSDKEEATKLRRGNTVLLEALMDMVNQFFYHKDQDGGYNGVGDVLSHAHMSAEEGAISVLLEAGMAAHHQHGYVLLWPELATRKQECEK